MTTKTLAIYSLYGSGEHVHAVVEWMENDEDYTRLTEPVEVEFVDLPRDEVVSKQVEALNKKKDGIREEMLTKIAAVDEKIQKLMALEHKGE